MAYSTNNTSSVISVTNFGAKGDGVTENRVALQTAINSLYIQNGGNLLIPKGTFYYSGTLDLTGKNIALIGEKGSILKAFGDESAKKINISGANNIRVEGIKFDYSRTSTTHDTNQKGFINTINSENILIQDNEFVNSRNSMVYLGGGSKFVNVENNYFSGYFCGVYSYINENEQNSQNFNISNNMFDKTDAWCDGAGESAAIKLQTNPNYTGFQIGHVINANTIDATIQMGVELWSRGKENIVSNNNIRHTSWGVSLDNQKNTIVSNNNIKEVDYIGIEAASVCENCIFDGNMINGFQGTGLSDPYRYTVIGVSSSNTTNNNITLSNSIILGCQQGAAFSNNNQVNVVNNSFLDNSSNLILKNSSHLTVLGNNFTQKNASVGTHVSLDSTNLPITGVHISNNYFYGTLTYAGLNYYSPSTPQIYNGLVENNFIDLNSSGFYGFVKFDASPKNCLHRNNFTASGANTYNSIPDYSSLPPGSSPYGNSNIENGFQYYDSSSYTIPSGGVTGDGIWLCVWSGGGGIQNNVRVQLSNNPGADNNYNAIELWSNMIPYQSYIFKHTLYAAPVTVSAFHSIYKRAKTISHDSSTITNSVWVQIAPFSSGAAGEVVTIKYSKLNGLSNVYSTYTEPSDTINNANLYLNTDIALNQTYKFSNGISVGEACAVRIYSDESGVLQTNSLIQTSSGYKFPDGTIQTTAITTGMSGVLQSQINTLATSSQLYQTGSNLYNLMTGFSGANNIGISSGNYWSVNGSNIYFNSGSVGIGTSVPSNKLQVTSGHFALEDYENAIDLRFKTNVSDPNNFSAYLRKFPTSGDFRLANNSGSLTLLTHDESMIRFGTNSQYNCYVTGGFWGFGGTYYPSNLATVSIYGSNSTSSKYAAIFINNTPAALMGIRNDGFIEIPVINSFTTANAANLYTDGNGIFKSTSSKKYKRNISDYARGVSDLEKLRPVTYQGKSPIDGDQFFAGFIAEEVHASGLTEYVSYNQSGEANGLHYAQMTALLVNAVKELSQRVSVLEEKLKNQ